LEYYFDRFRHHAGEAASYVQQAELAKNRKVELVRR